MRDVYVYDGTDVLINKLGIRDFEQLKEAEANYCGNALAELVDRPEKGDFDEIHLQRIHYRIFSDIYEWAGEFRKINIEKPENALSGLSVEYSDIFEIRKDLIRILKRMKQENWGVSHQKNVELLSFYLTEVWKVHPFREGNTRTVMFFFYEYMDHLGIKLNKELLSDNSEYVRTAMVAASFSLEGVCERNYSYLEAIISEALMELK